MAESDGPPLSLRPVPIADTRPKSLAEFIARVNAQPGGFRSVTEASLRAEIAAREDNNDTPEPDDALMEDETAEGEGAATKDPVAARHEVLKNVDIAGNNAMLTLDFLSLLLSKQNPTQASSTLSQQLRDLVGIGTIGADKLHEPLMTAEKAKDNEDLATGWTLIEINKTRDAAEEASAFLHREIEAESKYWEEVITVQKAGWSLCKVPQERHTLGVRFGFSEAAPEFKVNGLAPMRRSDDGSIELDCGRSGSRSERVLVTYEKDGKVVSRCALPAPTSQDAPLEARVLEARNTIFSQELWHELTREARTLVAYNVRPQGSRLTCALSSTSNIILELVPVDSNLPEDASLDTSTADAISISLQILLSYAHRHNELLRTQPIPPHMSRRTQQSYALLRPIIARMMHQQNVLETTNYVGSLVQAMKNAGLPASFTLRTAQLSLPDISSRGPNQPSAAQSLVSILLQPLDFSIAVTLLPDVSFTVRGRTFLFRVTATYYHVVVPPGSRLETICAPYKDGYPDTKTLADYLRTATAHVLVDHFLAKLSATPKKSDWLPNLEGTSIRDALTEGLGIRFAVEEQDDKPTFAVTGTALKDGKSETKRWVWAAAGPSEAKPLYECVGELVGETLS
jgi:mediator of RNA polymerase II transcription subunit 17